MTRIDRRSFFRYGAAIPGAYLLSAAPTLTSAFAEQSPSKSESGGPRKQFLFVDWFHVKKGELEVVLDPSRISEEGRKLLAQYAHDFNKTFPLGTQGRQRVDIPYGVCISQEVATKSQSWLIADKPWEESVADANVLRDEGRFRCWYRADLKAQKRTMTFSEGRGMEVRGAALAYAESQDGWNWTKPALKILPYGGSLENNLVTPYGNGGCVFRDDHGLPEERYKTFHFDKLPKNETPQDGSFKTKYGLYGVASPDGYRWTKKPNPLVRYFCDTFNIAAWDPLLGKYVGYFRYRVNDGRAISRAETVDFWNWPAPRLLLCSNPLDTPADDYYTNGYTCYPDDTSLRLLFVAVYHRNTDLVDVRAALSRDGRVFQWISYNPIIRLDGAGKWDGGSLYANPSLIHLPDGRLALPYIGYSTSHNEAWYKAFYDRYKFSAAIAWAIWEDARLAGIEASDLGGFTTQEAHFEGRQIQINVRTTRSGSVRVELREHGKSLEGFSFADSIPFNGDTVWSTCKWKEKHDLSGLRGKKLELAIRLTSAKIFAYRFV